MGKKYAPRESVRDKIERGLYTNTLEWPGRVPHRGTPEERLSVTKARHAYHEELNRLMERFKADALEEVKLTGHKNADKIWDKAWSDSHADGLMSVLQQLEELADLVL